MPPDRTGADSDGSASAQRSRRPYRAAAEFDALVIGLLRQSNAPLTAYEIARRARAHQCRISPTQVYRALHRLMAENAVERVELLAAYLPRHGEPRGFLVCRRCRSVMPFTLPALQAAARGLCRTTGFRPARILFESWGICRDCAQVPPPSIGGKALMLLIAAGAAIADGALPQSEAAACIFAIRPLSISLARR
ncbi:MAG: hypothetical protein CVT74_06640 [Alphaproteobacteria bacterium HGW-Alphaproteobacteria-13]|jgi:Fur family zinc uptake transcriptional regulator|nr:MAG: hypothetical protein CVT74_06640 [Alphaproteobacteria bacterium HGW-Alphaproteobacteria-13]